MRLLLHPGGLLLVALVWLLMVFCNYATLKYVIFRCSLEAYSELSKSLILFVVIVYELSLLFAWISHALAVLTNTAIKIPLGTPAVLDKSCHPCGGRWKPPRAHHCRSCSRCIYRMDHHCPWINNCVGLANQKYFILFLIYAGLSCFINICLLLFGLYIFFKHPLICQISPVSASAMTCVFLVCAFFLYMTMEFLSEQWEAIETNSTLIENYKGTRGRQTDSWEALEEIFGKNWLWWCLPIPPQIQIDYTDPVYTDEEFTLIQKRRNSIATDGLYDETQDLTNTDNLINAKYKRNSSATVCSTSPSSSSSIYNTHLTRRHVDPSVDAPSSSSPIHNTHLTRRHVEPSVNPPLSLSHNNNNATNIGSISPSKTTAAAASRKFGSAWFRRSQVVELPSSTEKLSVGKKNDC
eukprot:GHVS01059297.1.p1 GENE.GHVS01059297.1~~GHVS01059297.1.p1  ORF type:complete len:409 (+),score=18.53 GHVS01059297.1:119-1345(+)